MKIRKLALACSGGALIGLSTMASAESTFSGNVALTTDYIFRGVSQTDNGAAVQGGFDWEHNSGLSAGIWASNVDFGDGDDSNIEIDYYGAYGFSLGDIDLSVGALYYDYPSESVNDYWEATAGASYKIFSAAVYYSPDFFAETDSAYYYEAGLDFELPMEFGLGLHVGYSDFEDEAKVGFPDYTDWKVGISKEVAGFGFELAYTDTDMSDSECGSDICDARAVFTVSRAL